MANPGRKTNKRTPVKRGLTRFMVISYYSDEQQTTYDVVDAIDGDTAQEIVQEYRQDAVVISTWSEKEWKAANFNHGPRNARELAEYTEGELEDGEWCSACNLRTFNCTCGDTPAPEPKSVGDLFAEVRRHLPSYDNAAHDALDRLWKEVHANATSR